MVTMSREHTEIERLVDRFRRHLDESPNGLRKDQVDALRATLYGLDAVLNVHFRSGGRSPVHPGAHRNVKPVWPR